MEFLNLNYLTLILKLHVWIENNSKTNVFLKNCLFV